MLNQLLSNYRDFFRLIPYFALVLYYLIYLMLLKTRSIKLSKTWFVPIFALYFGVVSASIFAIFFDGAESVTLLSKNSLPALILKSFNPLNKTGKVMYGGYFGSIIGIWLANFIAKQKSHSTLLDISAISWSLFLVIWRLGCFAGGCCFGMPSRIFGISFPRGTTAFFSLRKTDLVIGDATVPLLPTQLISAVGNFAIFLFLLILFCKNKTRYPYFYLFAHAFLYGAGRFIIEFFRIDPREFWGPLSMSQWFSLVMIAAALVFFIKNRKEIAQSFGCKQTGKV